MQVTHNNDKEEETFSVHPEETLFLIITVFKRNMLETSTKALQHGAMRCSPASVCLFS